MEEEKCCAQRYCIQGSTKRSAIDNECEVLHNYVDYFMLIYLEAWAKKRRKKIKNSIWISSHKKKEKD